MAAFETEAMVEIDSAIRSVILVTVSLDLNAVLLMVIQVINAEKGASKATSSKVVPSAIAIDTIVAQRFAITSVIMAVAAFRINVISLMMSKATTTVAISEVIKFPGLGKSSLGHLFNQYQDLEQFPLDLAIMLEVVATRFTN